MLMKLIKILITSMFLMISNSILSQSIIIGTIVKENPSGTIKGELTIIKNIDGEYYFREKEFNDYVLISLDPGEYVLEFHFLDRIFVEKLIIQDEESIITLNILENPISLSGFKFSNYVPVTPNMLNLTVQNKKFIYIEF